MRKILFRGKRIDSGEWVEGHYGEYMLMSGEPIPCISIPNKEAVCGSTCCDVEASTVGQYTGLTDKNGKKIFEGDIVIYDKWSKRVICYEGAGWKEKEVEGYQQTFSMVDSSKCYEVVGNIHDNPELLEVTK